MKLQIILDNNEGVYAPGDSVSGHVEMDINLRQCEVHFTGNANVFWTEQGDTQQPFSYAANEEYSKPPLLVEGANEESELPGGCHSLPFEFQLPTNLPATFVSSRGWVNYSLEAVIDETKDRCNVQITVIRPVDCNDNPELLDTMNVDGSKKFRCCCCAKYINASFEVQRQAYCAGETILHTVEIANGSSRDVVPIIELYQIVICKAVGRIGVFEERVCKIVEPKISEDNIHGWKQKPLVIPPEVAPTLTNCNIIESTYVVRLTLCVPWTIDYRVDIPILIGTIPPNATPQHDVGYNTQSGVVTQQPSVSHIVPAVSYTNDSVINLGLMHDQSGGHQEEGASDDTFMGNTGEPM